MSDPSNTKTIIANLALRQIKQEQITSPDDASENARVVNLFYDRARRAALRACDWNFATDNQGLVLLGSVADATFDPTFVTPQDVVPGYLYCYQEPKCVRVRRIYAPQTPDSLPLPYIDRTIHDRVQDILLNKVDWRVMQAPKSKTPAIVTNLQSAWAEMTVDVPDESRFDDMFVDAFAYDLALKICLPLTADKELWQIIKSERDEFVGEAKRKNGGEGTEQMPRGSNYEAARD